MRYILIGSVDSSERTLQKLIEHDLNVVGVFGYTPADHSGVSGFVNLQPTAEKAGLPFFPFQRINDHGQQIAALKPDIVLVVGLSQLVSREILQSATHFCVGFHPTMLPQGRGRAPLAWLVHEQIPGAATFFEMGEGADDGAIFIQSPFTVADADTARDVAVKILAGLDQALDVMLPRFKNNDFHRIPQNHSEASYFGRRSQADGVIDWHNSAGQIKRLVKAASHPHPGAFSFYNDAKVTVWDATEAQDFQATGVVGSILHIDDDSFIVQTGTGLLKVIDYESPVELRVGGKLGYYCESEIYALKKELHELKAQIAAMTNSPANTSTDPARKR